MKGFKGKNLERDRTYKEVVDSDYLDQKQYMLIAISLSVTHFFFEFMYIGLGCTPMIYINIVSFFVYIFSIFVIKSGKSLIAVWFMILEIYIHVIFASIFMGMACGFQLWLFGTMAAIFLPFFIPDISGKQKRQIGSFSFIIVVTFITLAVLNDMGLFPDQYNVNPPLARIMYYINAFLGFGAIMLYTAVYNFRMAYKNSELQFAAEHDFLTGIFNRQRMQKILDAEILREQEYATNTLKVAIADIDFFKQINDTYGHVAGDEALKELTTFFLKRFDDGLLYGRWGGEEFLLIAPEKYTYDEFAKMLEDIRKEVEEYEFICDGKSIKFTISIGASAYAPGMTSEQLVNTADDRLYSAKETGRNKVVY